MDRADDVAQRRAGARGHHADPPRHRRQLALALLGEHVLVAGAAAGFPLASARIRSKVPAANAPWAETVSAHSAERRIVRKLDIGYPQFFQLFSQILNVKTYDTVTQFHVGSMVKHF